jgi:predicted ATP-grasp superfamily ATP-dependent carboligase
MLEVAQRFPESPLCDYIAFALGRNLSRPFKDYSIPRLRPADCEAAAKHFKEVRPEALPAVLQIQMRLAQARCARTSTDPEALRNALDAAKRLINDKPEFQKLQEQAKTIEAQKE